MPKMVYMDPNLGSPTNSGLTPGDPRRGFEDVRDVVANGDLVLMAPGVYLPPDISWSDGLTDADVTYLADFTKAGRVIIDFQNRPPTQNLNTYNWFFSVPVTFVGALFRNPFAVTQFQPSGSTEKIMVGGSLARFIHCAFYQEAGPIGSGAAIAGVSAENCGFYNLFTAIDSGSGQLFNNYLQSINTPVGIISGPQDYNAWQGNTTSPNAIDISQPNQDPGFVQPSGLNPDFSLDTVADPVAYALFATSGRDGGGVGPISPVIYYDARIPQLRFLSADPDTVAGSPMLQWENDGPGGNGSFTAGTPGDVFEDPVSYELTIDPLAIPGTDGGRVSSDVYDLSTLGPEFKYAWWSAFEQLGLGVRIDTDLIDPPRILYRSQPAAFVRGLSEGTLPYTVLAQDDVLSNTDQYIQFALQFQVS